MEMEAQVYSIQIHWSCEAPVAKAQQLVEVVSSQEETAVVQAERSPKRRKVQVQHRLESYFFGGPAKPAAETWELKRKKPGHGNSNLQKARAAGQKIVEVTEESFVAAVAEAAAKQRAKPGGRPSTLQLWGSYRSLKTKSSNRRELGDEGGGCSHQAGHV